MDENPYASPENEGSKPEVPPPEKQPPQLPDARFSILLIACICGTIAAISAVAFVVNLFLKYPGTDTRVLTHDPLFVAGHVFRGVGLGMLTWRLLQYRAAIRLDDPGEVSDRMNYLAAHRKLWNTAAIVLCALVIYSIAYFRVAEMIY